MAVSQSKIARKGDGLIFLELASTYVGKHCFIWPYGRDGDGYGMIQWAGKMRSAHRIVCERAHGPPPEGKNEVAHSSECRDKACVNPAHLRWASTKENAEDRKAFGRHNAGSRNGHAVLTEEQVLAIRAAGSVEERRKLAEAFGISVDRVHHIARDRSLWAHVQ